jgi:hypothetical protein
VRPAPAPMPVAEVAEVIGSGGSGGGEVSVAGG